MVENMLNTAPPGADKKEAAMWLKMKPLTIRMFEKFLKRVKPEDPVFDLKNAKY